VAGRTPITRLRTVPETPVAGAPAHAHHLRPRLIALVTLGGVVGAAARESLEQAIPGRPGTFQAATFLINLLGAFALGLLLEALARSGDDLGWRHAVRLFAGVGFCGAFTTYSTLALDAVQLGRHGAWPMAAVYTLGSVVGGLLLAALGIAVGAAHARWSIARLPVDPDAEDDEEEPG
jgi:CrcB protein